MNIKVTRNYCLYFKLAPRYFFHTATEGYSIYYQCTQTWDAEREKRVNQVDMPIISIIYSFLSCLLSNLIDSCVN